MSAFHFIRPWCLLGLLPLLWYSWKLASLQRSAGAWARWCDAALLPHILDTTLRGRDSRWLLPVFSLTGCLAVLALAGPTWERLPAPVFRNDTGLVIALDLSHSMGASDVKPNRLEKARFKITDLLKMRRDGYSALVVYSGDAFTVTPLTDDRETIISQLGALNTELLPTQGSRADLALERSVQLLEQAGLTHGDILLISSGVNLTKGSPAAEQLHHQGYRLSVLGVGSEAGAPVPLPEGGFLQDGKGATVISRLAAPALQKLAADGGGMYQSLSVNNADLSALTHLFESTAQSSGAISNSVFKMDVWLDRGLWLLPLLLLPAALGFRRGILVLLIAVSLYTPESAQALEWRDLWQTPDQQGFAALKAGEPQQAADKFNNPDWKSAALYQAQRFDEAAEVLNGIDSANAAYNRGNALAKQGNYQEALNAYDQALTKNPDDADARYNRDLVEKKLQEQQKQQDKSDKSSDKKPDKQNPQQDKKPQDSEKPGQQADDAEQKENSENGEPENNENQDENADQHADQDKKQADAAENKQAKPQKQPTDAQKSEQQQAAEPASAQRNKEDQQATEQWLRRIPDDPAGLLKRKFYYQYQQKQQQ